MSNGKVTFEFITANNNSLFCEYKSGGGCAKNVSVHSVSFSAKLVKHFLFPNKLHYEGINEIWLSIEATLINDQCYFSFKFISDSTLFLALVRWILVKSKLILCVACIVINLFYHDCCRINYICSIAVVAVPWPIMPPLINQLYLY